MHVTCRCPVTDQLKSRKTDCSNTPQDLWPIKIQFWGSRVPVVFVVVFFLVPRTNLILFTNKIEASVQSDGRVDQCSRTSEAPCSGWSKWPCIVHGQSALCFLFVGSIAEPKVNSWSEATLRQLFQDWLSMMWTSTCPVLFTTTDFVFCKSGVLLFLHYRDTVCY